MSKPEEPSEPSFGNDLNWAARESRDWIIVLFRRPGDAAREVRDGFRSETFQERVHRWKHRATVRLGRVPLNIPFLVGLSAAGYATLQQSSLVGAVSVGLTAGVLTHVAFLLLPFALLGVLVLLLFLGLRVVALGFLPEPPDSDAVVIDRPDDDGTDPGKHEDTPDPKPAPAPTPEPNDPAKPKPDDILLKRVNSEDCSLLERILFGPLFKLTDPKDLDLVKRWITSLRNMRSQFAKLQEASSKLVPLSQVMNQSGLFELGLLHGSTYSEKPIPREEMTEDEWQDSFDQMLQNMQADILQYTGTTTFIEIYADGSSDADQFDEFGEPEQRHGQLKLISPVNHGYVFVEEAVLDGLKAPDLVCRVVHGIVDSYVKATGDTAMMDSWKVISRAAPSSWQTFLTDNSSPSINVAALEEDLLSGAVDDTSVRDIANVYYRYRGAVEEFEDYIAHQQRVAGLTAATLTKALKQIHATEAAERSARVAARKDPSSPYSNPYRSAGNGDKKPVETREQRRAKIAAVVHAAVPTEKGKW